MPTSQYVSDQQLRDVYAQYRNDPNFATLLANAQQEYGVSADRFNSVTGYNPNANTNPTPAATPAPTVNPNDPWGANIQLQGGVLTQQAIKDFFASNPSNQQILKRASELGMTQDQMRQAINSAGLLFTPDTTGQSTLPQAQVRPNGTSLYNDLVNDLWSGDTGYGLNTYGMAGGNAQIVAGTGHNPADMGGGAIQWQEYGTGQNSAGPGNGGYANAATATRTTPLVDQPSSYQPSGGVPGPLTTAAGVMQPGWTAGNNVGARPPMNWGNGQAPSPQFQTPMLNSLYNAQQQRMTTPAPSFNFQAQTQAAPQPGALTQAVQG